MNETWSSYGSQRLGQHRKAYQMARAQAVCNCVRFYDASDHHKNCPLAASNLLKRAEQIRQEMDK